MGASKKKRGQGGELKVILWAQFSIALARIFPQDTEPRCLLDSHRTGCCLTAANKLVTPLSRTSRQAECKREAAQEDNSESSESIRTVTKTRQPPAHIQKNSHVDEERGKIPSAYFAFCAAIPIDQDEVQGRNCCYRCLARGISFSMFSDQQLQNRIWSVAPMPPAANSKDISAVSEQQ